MYSDGLEKKILAFCGYCKSPIYEGENYIVDDGVYYHYDRKNKLLNCYFKDEDE